MELIFWTKFWHEDKEHGLGDWKFYGGPRLCRKEIFFFFEGNVENTCSNMFELVLAYDRYIIAWRWFFPMPIKYTLYNEHCMPFLFGNGYWCRHLMLLHHLHCKHLKQISYTDFGG